MIFRVFDFETTGFPEEGKPSAVIQLGWTDVDYDERAKAVRSIGLPTQRLCNPFRANPSLEIDIGAMAVHHIMKDDLKDAQPIDMHMRDFLRGADAFACHNKEHDGHYFKGGDKPLICTLKAAQNVWPDMERHSNQYLRYALKLPVDRALAEPPHHAGPDSYVTAYLLGAILAEGAELPELIEWSNLPVLQKVCRFGKKHYGKPFEEIPTDDLLWMRNKATGVKKDTLFTVNYHLDKRGAL